MDHLLASEEEKGLLCSDLLIGVTSFFRDEAAFKSLGRVCTGPAASGKKSIRRRSIACSTGEEAYSIAILLCEYMERLDYNADVKILPPIQTRMPAVLRLKEASISKAAWPALMNS